MSRKAFAFFVARRRGGFAVAIAAHLLCASELGAQVARPGSAPTETGFDTSKQWRIEQPEKHHLKLIGDVEARRGDMTFTADEIESFTDTHRVIAKGGPGRPVVFTQGGQWIAAERVEFDTETQLGTFYEAYGSFSLGSEPKRSMHGGQEPDILFNGRTIEKVGPKKYRITGGGFTTCLQPSPRWNVTAGTVVLNLDRYAFMRGAVLRAKGLPVLYLPFLYYPINDEDRATGFLMPAYGTSTYRGFTLSNAFFWAINRSHDATFLHDWFAKRGQGMGVEYRHAGSRGAGSDLRFYTLRERESTITVGGEESREPKRTSYEIDGNINQPLGGSWSARGNVDYFTDIEVQQTYHTNIYDSSRSQRSVNAGLSGSIGQLTLNANYRRSEYFSGSKNTTVVGNAPQIQVSRGEQPLFGLPLYFGVTGEYAGLQRETHRESGVTDANLSRLDVTPTLRFPFNTLRWLTVNTSLSFRETWWSRSRVAGTNDFVDDGISRRYAQVAARVVGPVVNRVFDTPWLGYAERIKHTVEPYVDIRRVTRVDDFDEIIQHDGTDSVVGGTTSITYGVNNRLLAKRRGGEGASSPREFVTVGLSQTYYSDSKASQYDRSYPTSYSGLPASKRSPVSLSARFSPTQQINGSLRMEYDDKAKKVRSLSASWQYAASDWLNLAGGYSQRRVIDYGESTVTETKYRLDNSINLSTTLRSPGNRFGGSYALNYDIDRSNLLNSRVIGYYNAQCCGFAVEYQTVSYGSSSPIGKDNRFNFSFTLAGLGTFSNFFGALGGGGVR